MDSQNVMNREGKNTAKRRKFTPNITKALAKKSQAHASKSNVNTRKSHESAGRPSNVRARINRKALDSDEPRFVQGYSMFEDGIGCAEKSDRARFERDSHSSWNNKGSSKTTAETINTTEVQSLDNEFSTLADVQQVFKYPPNVMPPDPPEVATQFKRAPPSSGASKGDNQSSVPSSACVVRELFDENKPNGSLFSLRIPDALLYEGSPLLKTGKFGKIQILDNGETRLVIGDCFFRLTSPGWTPYSTDLVLVEEEEGDGVVNLTSLGHIEQFVTAVPDLDQFTRLGR